MVALAAPASQLVKAQLIAVTSPEAEASPVDLGPHHPGGRFEFYLNPAAIKTTRELRLRESPTVSYGAQPSWPANELPLTFAIERVWFDTYESRECVRQRYVDALERLVQPAAPGLGPAAVTFLWGEFTHRSQIAAGTFFWVQKVDASYTMFLPDGTPVRAEVGLTFRQCPPPTDDGAEAARDATQARSHTVRAGQTLQALAHEHYGDPRQWRRIADANRIGDPMRLAPGSSLLLPPRG